MYDAINTSNYPNTKPISGNRNLSWKVLGVFGTPILFVLLTMSITMFNILCEMAVENGWDQIGSYWLAKTLEHPFLNIMLPMVICLSIALTIITWRK